MAVQGLNISSCQASVDFKKVKAASSNNLIHTFEPAEREDGELGLLDTITNKFYTNAGTGTFEKGECI